MTVTTTLMKAISGRMTGSSLFPPPWGEGWSDLRDRHGEGAPADSGSPWWVFNMPVGKEKSTFQSTNIFLSRWETGFIPRTELGRRLYALRTKAINAGMKLLSEEEILEAVKKRRGEIDENEKNLY